jgi:hypothetical protein
VGETPLACNTIFLHRTTLQPLERCLFCFVLADVVRCWQGRSLVQVLGHFLLGDGHLAELVSNTAQCWLHWRCAWDTRTAAERTSRCVSSPERTLSVLCLLDG